MIILKKWKQRQKQDYFILGYNINQTDQLVFSNNQNEYVQPTKTQKRLDHLFKKYNLPKITTHGFRHTHCSLLFVTGAKIKELQDRLGHSDVKTTMDAHVT